MFSEILETIPPYVYCLVASAAVLILVGVWRLGWRRSALVFCLRMIWLAPFFLALWPRERSEELPRTLSKSHLKLLVDDSLSISASKSKEFLNLISSTAAKEGFTLKTILLSALDPSTKKEFTPLAKVLPQWLEDVRQDPWILLSDGGDQFPTQAWSQKLKRLAPLDDSSPKSGMVLSLAEPVGVNFWLTGLDVADFGFDSQEIRLSVTLGRDHKSKAVENVQLQVRRVSSDADAAKSEVLFSNNVRFLADESEVIVPITIPPQARGAHVLEVSVVAVAGEGVTWDNVITKRIEVMANTIGVLHLLGSPSWDGRYLRRFLKGEPKYDLISFFILRDPWDGNLVAERELSLIPFPVERLFTEELKNFRILILQNFALFQFLEPQYQKNIVDFVKGGGSLLFLGGPRALQRGDLQSSPLAEVLPFSVDLKSGPMSPAAPDNENFDEMPPMFGSMLGGFSKRNPIFNPELAFQLQMAKPSEPQRALASCYEDLRQLKDELEEWQNGKGAFELERFKFDVSKVTPLLSIMGQDGVERPMVLASYPEKGRAIWVLSDSFWRLANEDSKVMSRSVYNRLMEVFMNWLARDEAKRPLRVDRFEMFPLEDEKKVSWQVSLSGVALRYFSEDWDIRICSQRVDPKYYAWTRTGNESVLLEGVLSVSRVSGCVFDLKATHPAFGQVHERSYAFLPERLSDKVNKGSVARMRALARHVGAEFIDSQNATAEDEIRKWVHAVANISAESEAPKRLRTKADYFWVLDHWLIFLCLLALPLEALVRCWPRLRGK